MRIFRPRPGRLEPVPALSSPGLSRNQVEVHSEEKGVTVRRVGRCPMRVNGVECEKARLDEGDTVVFRQELVLIFLRRTACPAPLSYWDARSAHAFGAPDSAGIVGESPIIWRLRDQISFAAQSGQHVLFVGESGTGKELAARAVHRLSSRARRPLVARNAATLPAGLIDAEVFGNVRNYPNPGMADRPGLVGQADGGFLFLDEIGELALELQSHLLRVLDSGGEYQRLGEATVRRSDFCLLAATNRNPAELRHDLVGRLSIRVELPPLSERREDIPLILRQLVRRAAAKHEPLIGRFLEHNDAEPAVRVDTRLIDALLRHIYRANTRELEAMLWKAMAASKGDVILAPADLLATEQRPHVDGTPFREVAPARRRNREPTDNEVRDALRIEAGNVAHAAKALGLSNRYALYRLLQKRGIDPKKVD